MLKLTFTVKNIRKLADIAPQQRADVLYSAAGHVRGTLEEHFRAQGGRKFWPKAADSVHVSPQASEGGTARARIEILKHGVALRFFGGVVKPRGNISDLTGRPTKSLLIPGKELRANGGELIDVVKNPKKLHVIKTKAGKVLLVEDIPGKKGKEDEIRIHGQLVKRTVHKPNPRVLPTVEQMQAAAREGAAFHLRDIKLKPEE